MNAFAKKFFKNNHSLFKMFIIKWTHFCFSWYRRNRSSKVTFLHVIMKPFEIVESSLNFPNSIFRKGLIFYFFHTSFSLETKNSFNMVSNVRESEDRIWLFFCEWIYLDWKTIEKLTCFFPIFVDSCERFDFLK